MIKGRLCNVLNCKADHQWTGEQCPMCKYELIKVGSTGFVFCSNPDTQYGCDYEQKPDTGES